MEEEVLKIMDRRIITKCPVEGYIDAAKEINSMYMEFADWLTINTMRATTYSPMFYKMIKFKPDISKEYHIDELFEYWNKHIRKP